MTVNPGTYDVRVTPPPDGIYAPQTLPDRSIVSDTLLDLALVPTTAASLEYSGQVIDRFGAPMALGIAISLCPTAGGPCFFADVDASGAFTIDAAPGAYTLRLQATAALPNRPQYFLIARPLTLSADTNVTIMLENRSLSGQLVGPGAVPVPNASVSGSSNVSFGGFSGQSSNSTTSNMGGNFQMTLFAGAGFVAGVPPQGSGVGDGGTNVDLTNDAFVTLTLPAAVTYSGQVVDRNGVPFPWPQGLRLYGGVACVATLTDAQGSFALSNGPGNHTLSVEGHLDAAQAVSFAVSGPLTLTQNTVAQVQIPNRILSGLVRDSSGTAVGNLTVSIYFSQVSFAGFQGYTSGTVLSAANGHTSSPSFPVKAPWRSRRSSVGESAPPPSTSRSPATWPSI